MVFTVVNTFTSSNKADDGEQAVIGRSSSTVAEEGSVNPSQQGDTELRYSNAARPQASDTQEQEDRILLQVYEAKEQDDGALEHQNRREEPSIGVQETEVFMPQQTQDAQERDDGTKQQIEDVQEGEGVRDWDSIIPQEREIRVREQLDEARANIRHSHCYI